MPVEQRRESEQGSLAPLPDLMIAPLVRAALEEDLGRAGDITSSACIPEDARLRAAFVARKPGVVARLACARVARPGRSAGRASPPPAGAGPASIPTPPSRPAPPTATRWRPGRCWR